MTDRAAFKKAIKALKKLIRDSGGSYRVTSSKRSLAKQTELYETPGNPYPVAEPGKSQHNYGLAEDLVINPQNLVADAGFAWTQAGYGWNSNDPVHFAYYTNAEWSQILGLAEEAPVYASPFASAIPSWMSAFNIPLPGYNAPSGPLQTSYSRAAPDPGTTQVSVPSISTRGIATGAPAPSPVISSSSIAVRTPVAAPLIETRDYTAPSTSSISGSTYTRR